jgi:hypothetical protein
MTQEKEKLLMNVEMKVYIAISLMCYECKSFVYIMIRIETKYLEKNEDYPPIYLH